MKPPRGYNRDMPIYEYACRACRHEFETLVRGAEAPSCGSARACALRHPAAIRAVRAPAQ